MFDNKGIKEFIFKDFWRKEKKPIYFRMKLRQYFYYIKIQTFYHIYKYNISNETNIYFNV